MTEKAIDFATFDTVAAPHLPQRERVLDKLADILFASDEIIDMLSDDSRASEGEMRAVETTVRSVYHQVNELMRGMVD